MKSKTFILWISLSLAIHAAMLGLAQRRPGPSAPTEPGPIEIGLVCPLPIVSIGTDPEPPQKPLKRVPGPPAPLAQKAKGDTHLQQNKPNRRPPEPEKKPREPRQDQAQAPKQRQTHISSQDPAPEPRVEPVVPGAAVTEAFENLCETETGTAPNAAEKKSPPVNKGGPSQPATVRNPMAALRTPPSYRLNPPPPYPSLALKRHWQGEVWLRVLIDEQGQVMEAGVEDSSGYPILDQAALETVRDWKFYPAKNGGDRVREEVRLPIRFELR